MIEQYHPKLLLHPNIPKPLHGMAPRVVLGQGWWDKKRHAAYAEMNFRCHACGVSKERAMYHDWLEGHEFYRYNYSKGQLVLLKIVALCHACHNYIHSGRMQNMVNQGKMSYEFMDTVLKRGYRILDLAGLPHRTDPPKSCAPWHKWHMIIEGKKYYSKFKNYEEWEEFYS